MRILLNSFHCNARHCSVQLAVTQKICHLGEMYLTNCLQNLKIKRSCAKYLFQYGVNKPPRKRQAKLWQSYECRSPQSKYSLDLWNKSNNEIFILTYGIYCWSKFVKLAATSFPGSSLFLSRETCLLEGGREKTLGTGSSFLHFLFACYDLPGLF